VAGGEEAVRAAEQLAQQQQQGEGSHQDSDGSLNLRVTEPKDIALGVAACCLFDPGAVRPCAPEGDCFCTLNSTQSCHPPPVSCSPLGHLCERRACPLLSRTCWLWLF
jgi:hypothetical protein